MKGEGFNVYAVEVEAALAEHPAVLMSALPKPVKGTILASKPRESGECRLSSSFALSRANSTYILATNVWKPQYYLRRAFSCHTSGGLARGSVEPSPFCRSSC